MRPISSGEDAAPPIMIRCMLETSQLAPASGQFSSAFAMVGTSAMPVAFSSWMSRSTWAGSKRRTITCRRPHHGGGVRASPAVGVEQRDGVQLHRSFVWRRIWRRTESACRYRVRCESITPLGVPVEPLV